MTKTNTVVIKKRVERRVIEKNTNTVAVMERKNHHLKIKKEIGIIKVLRHQKTKNLNLKNVKEIIIKNITKVTSIEIISTLVQKINTGFVLYIYIIITLPKGNNFFLYNFSLFQLQT